VRQHTKKHASRPAYGESSAVQAPLSQRQSHPSLPDNKALTIRTAMVRDRTVIKFHLRVSERAVFGGPAFDAHTPPLERSRSKRSAHHLYHLGLRNAQALLDGFERGSVFPSHLNERCHVAIGQGFACLMFH
jgi:hypothetical protein